MKYVIIDNKVSSFPCIGHHVPAHTGVRGQGFLPVCSLCLAGVCVINICPGRGWGVVLVVGMGVGRFGYILIFSKEQYIIQGSRFMPEASIIYKIPRETHRQEVRATGSWC